MGRTNIDIDDELIAAVMHKFQVKTKKEAVDLALRRAVGPKLTPELYESIRGIGWEGDLDELRAFRFEEWASEADGSIAG